MPNIITNATALKERDLFLSPLLATSSPLLSFLPKAICYRLEDSPGTQDGLISFLQKIQMDMTKAGVPADKQGVALILGTGIDASKPHAQYQVTITIVASAYDEDKNGKVTNIQNYVSNNELQSLSTEKQTATISYTAARITGDGDDPFDPNAANSYNTGGLWP